MPLKKKKKKPAAKRKPNRKKVVKKKPVAMAKKAPKKTKKSARKKAPQKPVIEGKQVGIVTHYFPHVMAAVIKLSAPLALGDNIRIKGHTSDLTQVISSMQIDRAPINQAKKGDEIGLQVGSRVRQHDLVYKI